MTLRRRIIVTLSDGRERSRIFAESAVTSVTTDGEWLSLVVANPRPIWSIVALGADYEKILIDEIGNAVDEASE